MKRKLLAYILIISVFMSLAVSASASEPDEGDYIGADISIDEAYNIAAAQLENDAGKDLEQIAAEHNAIVYHYNPYGEADTPEPVIEVTEEDTFDSVVDKLFSKYNVYKDLENTYLSHISLGYINLVTGEEHYYGEDTEIVSASLFKVPLNMIFCDKIANGEITYDDLIYTEPYKFLQYRTLSKSDNERALTLYSAIGGYISFKQMQRTYIGEQPYAEDEYIDGTDIKYTPKQVLYALKTVYSDQERYNGIIQNMLQAQPYEYFKMFQREYVVAQKYGFISQTEPTGDHTYINCCAIVYTDEPIAIVCMTDNISKAYDVIGEWSCLSADYAMTHLTPEETQEEQTEEENAGEGDASSAAQTMQSAEQLTQTEAPAALQSENLQSETEPETEKDKKMSLSSCIVIGLIIVLMLYCLVAVYRRNAGAEVNGAFAVIGIITASLAMILCVIASQRGTLYAKPEGDPGQSVEEFFNALKQHDYTSAYTYLEDYSNLGLENTAGNSDAEAMHSALTSSYDFTLKGEAEIDKLSAKQNVLFRYLDLNAVESDAATHVNDCLKQIIASKDNSEIYDDNNQYRTEITDAAYSAALAQSLENAENFYRTAEMTLELDYVNGKWMIKTSDELLKYILGGVSQ